MVVFIGWFVTRIPLKSFVFFDIDKETFPLFPSPPCDTFEDTRIPEETLAVLKGLCQSHIFVTGFTIWVMKEYGSRCLGIKRW